MKTRRVGFFLLALVPALAHAQTPGGAATRPRTVNPITNATPVAAQQRTAPSPSVTMPAPVSKQQPAPTVVPQQSVPTTAQPVVAPTPIVVLAPLQPVRPLPAGKVRTDIE